MLEKTNIILVPGKLLCGNCRKLSLNAKRDQNNDEMDVDQQSDEKDLKTVELVIEKDKLNKALSVLDVTLLKLKSLFTHLRKKYVKKV